MALIINEQAQIIRYCADLGDLLLLGPVLHFSLLK